jgi:FtsZ-binding cell division protein ZapB
MHMALGRYDYERRYRRRFWAGFGKLGIYVALLLTVGLFSYQMGIEQFKGRDITLREEVGALSRQKEELELLASQMQKAVHTAESRIAELEGRIARELPTGDLARLNQLAAERLAEGIDPGRLSFIIAEVQNARNCQPPEVRRFALQTPLVRTGVRGVTFGNNVLSVIGEGQSARNAAGAPEAWFDPAQPVSLAITTMAGKTITVSGVLPLHQSTVVDNHEYRFTFSAGPRSFIDVTADRCPFP